MSHLPAHSFQTYNIAGFPAAKPYARRKPKPQHAPVSHQSVVLQARGQFRVDDTFLASKEAHHRQNKQQQLEESLMGRPFSAPVMGDGDLTEDPQRLASSIMRMQNTSTTASLKQLADWKRRLEVPHASFDIDGDGFVSQMDFFISNRFDADKDGVLNDEERRNALAAMRSGALDHLFPNPRRIIVTENAASSDGPGNSNSPSKSRLQMLETRKAGRLQAERDIHQKITTDRQQLFEALTKSAPSASPTAASDMPALQPVSSRGELLESRRSSHRDEAGLVGGYPSRAELGPQLAQRINVDRANTPGLGFIEQSTVPSMGEDDPPIRPATSLGHSLGRGRFGEERRCRLDAMIHANVSPFRDMDATGTGRRAAWHMSSVLKAERPVPDKVTDASSRPPILLEAAFSGRPSTSFGINRKFTTSRGGSLLTTAETQLTAEFTEPYYSSFSRSQVFTPPALSMTRRRREARRAASVMGSRERAGSSGSPTPRPVAAGEQRTSDDSSVQYEVFAAAGVAGDSSMVRVVASIGGSAGAVDFGLPRPISVASARGVPMPALLGASDAPEQWAVRGLRDERSGGSMRREGTSNSRSKSKADDLLIGTVPGPVSSPFRASAALSSSGSSAASTRFVVRTGGFSPYSEKLSPI